MTGGLSATLEIAPAICFQCHSSRQLVWDLGKVASPLFSFSFSPLRPPPRGHLFHGGPTDTNTRGASPLCAGAGQRLLNSYTVVATSMWTALEAPSYRCPGGPRAELLMLRPYHDTSTSMGAIK